MFVGIGWPWLLRLRLGRRLPDVGSLQPPTHPRHPARAPTSNRCRASRAWVEEEGVKVLLAAVPLAILGSVATIPVLLAGGDPPPLVACAPNATSLEQTLATIRALESGGDHRARAAGSTASGAYQFINSTWDGYAGYPTAADAPSDIQDAKAAEMVGAILKEHGTVDAVPVVWYLGHIPTPRSTSWDRVPAPEAGNTLTPRQYQQRWLEKFEELGAADASAAHRSPTTNKPRRPSRSEAHRPASADRAAKPSPADGRSPDLGRYSSRRSARSTTRTTHFRMGLDHPARRADLRRQRRDRRHRLRVATNNWWEQGCTERGRNCCSTCGIGVTVRRRQRRHEVDLLPRQRTSTSPTALSRSGALLITSGNTGCSGTPHLHLEIRTTGGVRRCPQGLLATLAGEGIGINPAVLPTTGCSF